jgi:ketosteroid isomerase-like protein
MTTQHDIDEADIRQRIERLVAAVRSMDIGGLQPLYAPDIVTFDVQGPLQRIGAEAKEKNWAEAFAAFAGPLDYEIRDLSITVSGDLAVAHGFGRLSGRLRSGSTIPGFWVRWTACLRRVNGDWLIAHDHVSVPLDVESGRGLVNLEP